MTIDIDVLARNIAPSQTVLVLGAGSSIPSGAPSGEDLKSTISEKFNIEDTAGLTLADVASVVEVTKGRRQLIALIRDTIQKLNPTGGLLNIPILDWAGIYTTNFDDLIEKSFLKSGKSFNVFSSNHDFNVTGLSDNAQIYKFHGTIEKDVVDGHNSKLIITNSDYDDIQAYRELLYSHLQDQMNSKNVIIIGHSLADPDLRDLINQAQKLKTERDAPGRIYLLIYENNENLAISFESRGLSVCFGGVDEFFNSMLKDAPDKQLVLEVDPGLFGKAPRLNSSTFDVSSELANQTGQIAKMFNGRPAGYGDIARQWVFHRDICGQLETQCADIEALPISVVLGVAGVGKTTACRILLSNLSSRGMQCWEHKPEFDLNIDDWRGVAQELTKRKERGVLFIDDAHYILNDVNGLIEKLSDEQIQSLNIVLVSSHAHWNPRLKCARLYQLGKIYELSRLNTPELNGLLDLLDSKVEIKELVEDTFLGFSRPARLSRLKERCDADMFVCMKNIFGYQAIDTILLEEFASLHPDQQIIYKLVAGMQAIGTSIHRELVRRVTGLHPQQVAPFLEDMEGIIEEYTVSERDGIYGWRLRHQLIADILTRYKYANQDELYALFEHVISNINPSYKFETRSLNDLCDLDSGINIINDRNKQNVLLRRIISMAPNLRVPRHRLIYNLLELHNFEAADSEMRVFERELRADGPLRRYQVRLKLVMARHAVGIQDTDRAAMISEAIGLARKCVERGPNDKNMYRIFLETGVEFYRYSKDASIFEEAYIIASEAEAHLFDPDLRRILSYYTRAADKMGLSTTNFL